LFCSEFGTVNQRNEESHYKGLKISTDAVEPLNLIAYGSRFKLGYVVKDGEAIWFKVIVGFSNMGSILQKRVLSSRSTITAMAIRTLCNVSHMVILELGERVFSVYDMEDETGDHDAMPSYLLCVFQSVPEIRTEFVFHSTVGEEDAIIHDC
jgi:hypothetical protein